jgi:hypothetical protein
METHAFRIRLIFLLLILGWCTVLFFSPISIKHTTGHYQNSFLVTENDPQNFIAEDKTEASSCGDFRFFHLLGFSVYFYIFFPVLIGLQILFLKGPLRWYWIVWIFIQFIGILLLTVIFLFMMSWRLGLFSNENNEFFPGWGAWVAVCENIFLAFLLMLSVFFRKKGLAKFYRRRVAPNP